MTFSRRKLLLTAAGAALPFATARAAGPVRGGQLIVGAITEPTVLASAITTEGPTQTISGKLFDGLVVYDKDLKPQPSLATSWSVSEDGLSVTFKLRPNVTWHDGKPFTSEDVAFSVLNVWKKFHSRGRSTYANVVAAETPDPLTVIWKLSKPAPYILSALSSVESQVIPKHLYDGTDILTNPYNTAPVGTGPYRFAKWERGQYIVVERNPNYWDRPKPYLDRVIFRFIPDQNSIANGLETGEIHLSNANNLAPSDLARLGAVKNLLIDPQAEITSAFYGLGFNLDRTALKDVRLRRAFAHAIDQEFILRNIYHGFGTVETGPVPSAMKEFHEANVPTYPYDLAKAAKLLDEIGLKPNASGVRLSLFYDPLPTSQTAFRIAEYVRDSLGKVGVQVQIRSQDFASFIRRVYTERDMDLFSYAGGAGPDPVIGTQRLFWSKNFQPGVAFSNGCHYVNPEVDALLESAQTELNAPRRHALYATFQRIIETDLPFIPLVIPSAVTVVNRQVQQFHTDADGYMGSFADAYLLPT